MRRVELFTAAWALIIILLSLLPGKSLPSYKISDLLTLDKLGHIFFYGVLCAGASGSCKQRFGWNQLTVAAVAVVSCILFGLFIELIQTTMRDRYFEMLDILANIIGSIAGTIIFTWMYYKLRKK